MADAAMLKKVRGLLAVADDERSPEGERDNARALAAKLQAKHSITERDLAEHSEPGGLFDGIFAGMRWGNSVRSQVDTIWTQVDALVDQLLRDEKGLARAEAINCVYGLLRTKLGDATREPEVGTLKARRDEVLTDYYDAFLAQQRRSYAAMDDDEEEDEESRQRWDEYHVKNAYEGVAWRVRETGANLNKTTVERIVTRVKSERASKARWAKVEADRGRLDGQPCVYCGGAEPIKVPMNAKSTRGEWFTYEMDEEVSVHYPQVMGEGEPVPAHSTCRRDAIKASA